MIVGRQLAKDNIYNLDNTPVTISWTVDPETRLVFRSVGVSGQYMVSGAQVSPSDTLTLLWPGKPTLTHDMAPAPV